MSNFTPVFLSYGKEDANAAAIVHEGLKNIGIDCFFAPVDLPIGQDFRIKLMEKIKSCTTFVVLISQNYHISVYTDQELGIALGLDKHIIPICLDETIPYGFLDSIQCICCSGASVSTQMEKLEEAILQYTGYEKTQVDFYIEHIRVSSSWEEAGFWAQKIQDNVHFSTSQVNKIADAVIRNDQVRNSWAAWPTLKIILETHKKALSSTKQSQLKSLSFL